MGHITVAEYQAALATKGGKRKAGNAPASKKPRLKRVRQSPLVVDEAKVVCRITVPIDVRDANPNKKHRHWAIKRRIVETHREAGRAAWMQAGAPRAAEFPIYLNATVRRGRLIDSDNITGCLKHVRDGICNDALTPDDSLRYVDNGRIIQHTDKKYRDAPEVEFIFTVGSPAT